MTKTQEACVVIRDKNNDVVSVIVTQLSQRTHVFYKTEKMGVEEISELVRDDDKSFCKNTNEPVNHGPLKEIKT